MSLTFYPGLQDASGAWTYLPELEGLNVNNRNGADLASALGLVVEDGMLDPVPVGEFMNRCTHYLRRRLGHPDPVLEGRELGGAGGPVVIECARGEGYLQLRVMKLLELAREGAARGATHVYAA